MPGGPSGWAFIIRTVFPLKYVYKGCSASPQLFTADECKVFVQLITTTPPPLFAKRGICRDMRSVHSSPRPRSVSLVHAGPIGLWHCATLQLASCAVVMSPSHIPSHFLLWKQAASDMPELLVSPLRFTVPCRTKARTVWPENESDSRRRILGLRKEGKRNYRGRLHARTWKWGRTWPSTPHSCYQDWEKWGAFS